MKASAAVAAEAGPAGATRLAALRSQAPLLLRRTADGVHLVTGAAGPLGGDVLQLRVDVRAGATLALHTVASAVALPGRCGEESVFSVTANVAAGGRLSFLPEPTVVAARARHRVQVRVCLEAGAALTFRDELVLGRSGEPGGECRTRLHVDLAGRPLLRHELAVGGPDTASGGPAVLAGHRAVGSVLRVEPAWAPGAPSGRPEGSYRPGVAVMPLAGPAVLVTALAHDALTLRRRLTGTDLTRPVSPAGAGR